MNNVSEAVRAGEELDSGKLSAYLAGLGMEGALQVEQYTRGFSNLTYRVQVGQIDLVLRRPPFGSKVKSAHDVAREYRILQALHPGFGRVPRPVACCEDPEVLGAPFYLMERVEGTILRSQPPRGVTLDATVMHDLSTAWVDTLVDIHAVDVEACGLGTLARGDDYAARQVKGWTERYVQSRTDDIPDVEKVAEWLAAHVPPSGGRCLIHNDYKYDNLVLNPDRLADIRAVLDWEMATIGDPLMDLGTSLGYWLEAGDPDDIKMLPFGLTALPGNLTRREIVDQYSRRSGRAVDHVAFYHAYGLFKIAVVLQQIFYRYRQGLTQDPRFAQLGVGVRLLGREAWAVASG